MCWHTQYLVQVLKWRLVVEPTFYLVLLHQLEQELWPPPSLQSSPFNYFFENFKWFLAHAHPQAVSATSGHGPCPHLLLSIVSCFCYPWSQLKVLLHLPCIRSSHEALTPKLRGVLARGSQRFQPLFLHLRLPRSMDALVCECQCCALWGCQTFLLLPPPPSLRPQSPGSTPTAWSPTVPPGIPKSTRWGSKHIKTTHSVLLTYIRPCCFMK